MEKVEITYFLLLVSKIPTPEINTHYCKHYFKKMGTSLPKKLLIHALLLLQVFHFSLAFQNSKAHLFHGYDRQLPKIISMSKNPDMDHDENSSMTKISTMNRRTILQQQGLFWTGLALGVPLPAHAAATEKKCTDIESCREIGNAKMAQKDQQNPVIRLESGVQYKVLQPGLATDDKEGLVQEGATIDLIYSVSRGGGRYMYSQGFGYERMNLGTGRTASGAKDYLAGELMGKQNFPKDVSGIDSLRITVGRHQVPIGIELALVGMKRGERRRIELPGTPQVGFQSSNWQPTPQTVEGKNAIEAYRRILEGFGSQPAFFAPTIWDVEVLKIRS